MSKVSRFRGRETDHQRFERLLKPHFDALYGAARRLTRNADDAEDLVQEVCLKAFVRLAELEQIEYPRAWLLRVLYNVFIDDKRREQRSPRTDGDPVETLELAGDPQFQPEVAMERALTAGRLQAAMNILNREHCALLAMHDIDGYSLDELAKLSGLTESNLKSRLHRTREKLGRLLRHDVAGRPRLTGAGQQT